MADFRKCLDWVLKHEGGYVNHPNDPGGPTNRGITLETLSQHRGEQCSAVDVANLGLAETAEIYRVSYWMFDAIADDAVAAKIFDLCVNMGPHKGIQLTQQALRECGACISVDGCYGPETERCINNTNPKCLLLHLAAKARGRYYEICEKSPQMRVFLTGWLRRADSIPFV